MNRHLLIAIAILGPAATAGAATDPNVPSIKERAALSKLATCLFAREPQIVRDLVTKSDADQGIPKLIGRNAACADSRVANSPDGLLRGALAEAAFKRDYGRSTLEKVTAEQWAKSRTMLQTSMRKVALCLEENKPGAVEELIMSLPGSAVEQSSMAELQSELRKCADKPVSYYPALFRASLAVWSYRTASYYFPSRSTGDQPNA